MTVTLTVTVDLPELSHSKQLVKMSHLKSTEMFPAKNLKLAKKWLGVLDRTPKDIQ